MLVHRREWRELAAAQEAARPRVGPTLDRM